MLIVYLTINIGLDRCKSVQPTRLLRIQFPQILLLSFIPNLVVSKAVISLSKTIISRSKVSSGKSSSEYDNYLNWLSVLGVSYLR